jgi:glycosyltransferase involved in cell wall biosynthesis
MSSQKSSRSSKPPKKQQRDCFVSVVATIENVRDVDTSFFSEAITLLKDNYTNYELIIVANGVPDEPLESLASLLKTYPCIRVIRLARNYNQETATFAGLEAAIGDYTIVASPGSDMPSVIVPLVDRLVERNDIVFGVSKTTLPHPLLAKLGRRWFFWYSDRYLRIEIPHNATHLMGLNRRAINALTQIKGRHRHVRHISAQVGFKTSTFEYQPLFQDRASQRGLLSSMNLAMEIAVSYSHHPLRLVSKLSLLISGANLLIALYTILTYLFKPGRVVEGWTTLSLEISIMFFFVFLVMAVIAEYIGQMREELRGQPPYHIMEELTSNVLIADATKRNISK